MGNTNTVKAETIARNEAYKALLDWVTAQAKVPENVLEAAKTIRPSYFGLTVTGTTGDGLTPAYRKLLALNNGALPAIGTTWTEMELFEAYRFGRTEAKNWCNELSKLVCDQPRAWVKFDITERTYTLVAVQDTVPEGWGGYIPKELSADGKAVQASKK